jgi:hypothetical protein
MDKKRVGKKEKARSFATSRGSSLPLMASSGGKDKRIASTTGVVDAKSPSASHVLFYDARGLSGRLDNNTLTSLELL